MSLLCGFVVATISPFSPACLPMKPCFVLFLCTFGLISPTTGLAAESQSMDNWQFSFSGSHRSRLLTLDNPFRPGLSGSDQALSMRTLGRLQADRGALSLVIELQDSRNYLNDAGSGLTTHEINAVEPLQLYAAYNLKDTFRDGDALNLKAGLFTLGLGNQRLVGRHGYRNTIQNFSGVQVQWQPTANSTLTTFWVMPVAIRPADPTGLLDNDIERDEADDALQFSGIYYRTVPVAGGPTLETYLFGLHEQDEAGKAGTADRELYTPGFRILTSPASGHWHYELELAYQWGSRRAGKQASDTRTLDVSATFVQANLGYTFPVAWQPRLALEWTRGSGDRQPGNVQFERFDGLFGPRREFGPTGIYGILGRSNFQSAALRLQLEPAEGADVMLSLRHNTLAAARDTFASSGVRDASGQAGKNAGDQFEFRVRHWLKPQVVRLEAGGAFYRNGSFFDHAPNATGAGNPSFFYTDLTFFF